jgi:carboxymethylenebutenolidase
MGRWIDLDAPAAGAPDDRARGWLASPPEGASGPAVLVLHAWWGLNETARDAADRLAREGFVALAPDMYGGVVVDTIEDAEREGQRRSDAEIRPVVDAAVARLTGDDAVVARGYGVVGFSYGAAWALDQAAADPDVLATVVVYGTGGPGTWTPGGAVLGHFAADDPYEPAENVDWLIAGLEAAGREVVVHRYPGTGHWFMEPDRDAYNRDAAELAWARTIEFLRERLGPVGA